MAAASSSNPSSTRIQSRTGRFRRIFSDDSGLRAWWRFFIYLALFVVLILFLGTAMEYFVKPGSGILTEGLFELMGLVGAMGRLDHVAD